MEGRKLVLLALAGLGFASLGLPDGVIGVAWPSMRASFALPLDALGALLGGSAVEEEKADLGSRGGDDGRRAGASVGSPVTDAETRHLERR